MKAVIKVVGVVLALVLAIFVMQIVASETGEVVVLTSTGPDGEQDTRLWLVEIEGVPYLRAQADSGWYQRLQASPVATLERAGNRTSRRAESHPPQAAEVNRLMRAKYGWRDVYIAWMVGGREDTVAVAMLPNS
jgi:hypothetical protein